MIDWDVGSDINIKYETEIGDNIEMVKAQHLEDVFYQRKLSDQNPDGCRFCKSENQEPEKEP